MFEIFDCVKAAEEMKSSTNLGIVLGQAAAWLEDRTTLFSMRRLVSAERQRIWDICLSKKGCYSAYASKWFVDFNVIPYHSTCSF